MDLAEATNNDLVTALTGMENELQGYMNDADNGGGDEGPGAAPGEPVPAALEVLTDMAPIMAKPIRDPCPDGVDCVSDREALWVELRAMT